MPNPSDYRHIEAWGIRLGSFQYYITGQQELAASENAPINAIYRNSRGEWYTSDDIQNTDIKAWVEVYVAHTAVK